MVYVNRKWINQRNITLQRSITGNYAEINYRQTGLVGLLNQDFKTLQVDNLNFNYKIALLPSHVSDYIIVHELCHLKEFNHSQRFWDLVAIAIPDYLVIRKELKGELV